MPENGTEPMKNLWGRVLTFPEQLLYSPEMLWVEAEDRKVRIGLSDLIVSSTKHLVYVDIDLRNGARVSKGDPLGTLETMKTVSDIPAPCSGIVVEVNSMVANGDVAPIERDAYGEGWLVEMDKVDVTDQELSALLRGDSEETKGWIREQAEEIVPMA